ncbi:MAG: DUF3857 domain-containing protein [Bacteroidales bacterium]
MRLILLFAFIFSTVELFAQGSLAVSAIPDSLKKNSDSVVRFKKTEYRYKTESKIVVTEDFAVTIFNEKADDNSVLKVFYDSNAKVKKIEGTIYNSDGVKVDELKSKQIQDYSAYASYTLFSDSRVKVVDPLVKKYPYTVEYKVEVEYTGSGLSPSWSPIDDYRQSLEYASLTIYTLGNNIVSKLWNINPTYNYTAGESGDILTWTVRGIKSFDGEPYSPTYSVLQPTIFLSSNNTLFYGYSASFKDWLNYGFLVKKLIDGRDNLPENTIVELKNLCAGIASDVEKTRLVYGYVQNKVRYVNVSKGIGGYQPIEAQNVDKYGYGDCKALSNYTKALLKIVGINSYYTEIGSGDRTKILFEDFASIDQTNHAILVVPLKSDTIWLECTSSKIPFGYIGGSNSNRLALAITENGGELLHTPSYSSSDNILSTVTDVVLNESGDISLKVDKIYKNELFDRVMSYLYESKSEQEKRLYSQIALPGTKLNQFNFSNESVFKIPIGRLTYDATILQYGSITGNRLMFKPNILSKNQLPFTQSKRENDISFDTGITVSDTVTVLIPAGYKLEFDYPTTQLSGLCAEYESKLYSVNDNKLQYIRKFIVNRGVYSKDNYKEITDFFKKVALADNRSCVLVKL